MNCDSILNELRYFHVCDGSLLPDVMHDLLEGALQYEVKLLLNYMIDNSSLTVQEFSSKLQNIDLGYMEMKNKLTAISVKTMNSNGNSLKQMVSNLLCNLHTCMDKDPHTHARMKIHTHAQIKIHTHNTHITHPHAHTHANLHL